MTEYPRLDWTMGDWIQGLTDLKYVSSRDISVKRPYVHAGMSLNCWNMHCAGAIYHCAGAISQCPGSISQCPGSKNQCPGSKNQGPEARYRVRRLDTAVLRHRLGPGNTNPPLGSTPPTIPRVHPPPRTRTWDARHGGWRLLLNA